MEGPYLELVDLEHLHSSMFNPHIAHALREDVAAMNLLHSMTQSSHLPTSIRETAGRNVKLANGWAVAETLLSASPSVDEHLVFEHETFVTWLLEFVTWPSAFAPFLLNVLPLVSERRTDSRIQPVPTGSVLSEEQCITVLRACQGVSSVAIVTCWALLDSNFALAHRSLAILNMLRTHDYAEVRFYGPRTRLKLKYSSGYWSCATTPFCTAIFHCSYPQSSCPFGCSRPLRPYHEPSPTRHPSHLQQH